MSEARHFVDSNVLLYLISADAAKADRAEELIACGGYASVQVLNEFASVASRYRFYDCLILASALQAGCETLYSEDLHTGHIIDGQLTLQNPFS